MNNKQCKTLREIFDLPTRSNIKWTNIEKLFEALGATVSQGNGSRVRVTLNGVKAIFYEPHPENETNKGAVKSVREFLENAGIDPDDF